MDPTIAEEREVLEGELQRLEALLQLNSSWQALCLLKVRSGDDAVASDPALSAERARLEAALAGNRVFLKRAAVARAIAGIDVPPPDEPQAEPMSVETPVVAEPVPEAVSGVETDADLPMLEPSVPAAKTGGGPRITEEPTPMSLLGRLRRVRQNTGFDGARYAAYRSKIGEASVEIVRRTGPQARAGQKPPADRADETSGDLVRGS